eukprot:gene5352-3849_t
MNTNKDKEMAQSEEGISSREGTIRKENVRKSSDSRTPMKHFRAGGIRSGAPTLVRSLKEMPYKN